MATPLKIRNLSAALTERLFPTVTVWNRLEGRPRTDNFARALKAELRDALWMLTRQWQMAEFQGDDAGSPVFAKLHLASTRLRRYRPRARPAQPFDDAVPLEAEVERRPVALTQAGCDVALDLRLLAGRQWLKLLAPVGDFAAAFRQRYPVHSPDPKKAEDALICAHPEAWGAFAAAAGRRMDGVKLYRYLTGGPGRHAYDGIAALDPHRPKVDELAAKFVAWYERLIFQPPPSGDDAWEPSRLEYQFACSAPEAPAEKVLAADEYYHGRLDWYNFDVDPKAPGLGAAAGGGVPAADTRTLIPTPVTFAGMPDTRWWAFEDRRTNFGDIKPDTTDLAKLLLIEFGLVYANDWFVVPYELPAGSLARVRGLAVTNVFGERTWVEAAGRGRDDDWQRWAVFTLSVRGKGNEAADTSLFLPPTVPKVQEGDPLEEVLLIRDEAANMVWGVERTVPLPTGVGKPGAEAARETFDFLQAALAGVAVPPAGGAKTRYRVMTSVPENWIPFIPVRVPGSNREVQLQRAGMPRVLEGDPNPPRKVEPRTALLREGRDRQPVAAYFVHEEEVPRVGVRVTQSFQRTRWRDGRVWVWLGARKQTGRGEGSSGLAFDRVEEGNGARGPV